MACFRKLCKKNKKRKDPPVDHIIRELEETETVLVRQQDDLEKQIKDCINIAKTHAKSNKRMAVRALKKKKILEQNLEQVDDILTSLGMQKDALENAKTNAAIHVLTKNAGEAIKKANNKLNGDKVQSLMDDITEQHCVANEISTSLRKSLVPVTDEDELIRELDQLLQVGLNKQTSEENTLKFPSIPAELDIATTVEQGATKKEKTPLDNKSEKNITKE